MIFYLEQLAQYYLKKYSTDISDFCFVFPSQRAGVFFRKYLSDNTTRPTWSPKIITINDFFRELNPQPVSDNISLIFKLFKAWQEVMDPSVQLDDFVPFGEMCLSDFDDIDKYLVNADKLYRNLAEQKALEDDFSHLNQEQIEAIRTFWSSFDPQKYSKLQVSFLKTWEKMPRLYQHFNALLDAGNEAYEGKIYRAIAEKIKAQSLTLPQYKQIIFVGFNALNTCEKLLFNYLKIKKSASFFWDFPEWISPAIKEPKEAPFQHEAIRFIESNLLDFPMPDDWENPVPDQLPRITIATAGNDLAQTLVAGEFLKQVSGSPKTDEMEKEKQQPNTQPQANDHSRTAVILADETLLLPAIHAVPPLWGKINVTLGYPLKNTPAYGLLDALMSLQRSTRTTKEGKVWFYHRHLINVIRHQYISGLLEKESVPILEKLTIANQVFIEKQQLPNHPFLQLALVPVKDAQGLSNYFETILLAVYKFLVRHTTSYLEQEFVFILYLSVKRLNEILSLQDQMPEINLWYKLFRKLADYQTVAFKGEPLSGLQVMGILETRMLDFDHIIILGMNEGVFPHTAPPDSFIPFNLRKGYGLPTIDNQDSIFAYYFYRLLQRARDVTLVWSSANAQQKAGEMSRFLQQLKYEYPGKLEFATYIQSASTKTAPSIIPLKNRLVQQQIEAFLSGGEKYLSPSALSTYIECPLRFYLKYLAGAKEPDEISEDLDPRTFGNLFHQTVEKAYTPLLNETVTTDQINRIADPERIKQLLEDVFAHNVPFVRQSSGLFNDLQGKNSLIFEILLCYLHRFFEQEKVSAPLTLKALESKTAMTFTTAKGLKIKIGGLIDRVDQKAEITRVIDYKTGSGDNHIQSINELFDTARHSKKKAIFQTLLYALILKKTDDTLDQIAPNVVWTRTLFNKNYDTNLYLYEAPGSTKKKSIILEDVYTEFSESLTQLLEELFDAQIPFEQTPHTDNCTYCNFREICLR